MKTLNYTSTRQDILKTNADATAMRLFVLLVFLLLSCSGVFGQQAKVQNDETLVAIENVTDKGEEVRSETNDANRQIELVQWFMGAKQVNPSQPAQTSQKSETTKKILINAGMTPNRILSRTLLKKAMQYENNIA
ncbi:hypothetical protein HUK80_13310 [Flavobacterium sp. MAH-1]|uniref:Uncharacterized protein n=1 Tax=Flavobacterium agri TaxID=2743471 RepID=A0A7Y8Y5Y1_9FLAO|nr:hypothetical protein [Flavobacterium agri]NUY81876.1 hypothetical protein [Flavobacterium agri]NYA71900.1 hypothetical protein [Flavobacterium agri]